MVLTVKVSVRPNLIWRRWPLLGHAYPVLELSWQSMCVPLVELLHQAGMGWIPALEYMQPGARGVYGHVLSCQAVNAAASRDPGSW
jgi:hypothetical protein